MYRMKSGKKKKKKSETIILELRSKKRERESEREPMEGKKREGGRERHTRKCVELW